MRVEVAEYRKQAEEALNRETNLRLQVGKLRAAVKRLRDFIVESGLTPPEIDDNA